ncbi:murein L,D-transpeptidase catalytic domain-containing protein [Flavihumibacter profundi]|jgi:hypothetical protein|uniref:murein L,D-transpeptidase catalytic domain-containing protein n=1 Tax=Flavihumibacter profundi TaxID=2716883 RepID=UPI001CC44EA2|nr:murein L,D-transpeptidase catalytic domain family protein [Flavihumibacter profundi]MBZ5858524.1 murein L,D-transpeptidase catalytic domain family protein [Flavihumibacter profundi]
MWNKKRVWYIIPALVLLLTAGVARSTDNHGLIPPVEKDEHLSTLKNAALSLSSFARKNGLDDQVFFLVDMRLPSGKNRFFVYDLCRDTILLSGLVTHGKGNSQWQPYPRFSNCEGSGCTSLGKYKIGESYKGQFGLAYKLFGLDSTNSNAYNRSIVLHAHESVPENEVYPVPISQSEGCPTVSPQFLTRLDHLLKARKLPVMLYIFN